jgi:catechol 2,3-dioxygenase-like lactoylglutathione lyase family enzyme
VTRPRFFAHANVNTPDLESAEAFYETHLGLTPRWRTAPSRPQDGAGFGMPGTAVQWRGVLLADHRGDYGPVLDLLQWLLPPTEGRPYPERQHVGLAALLFSVPDLAAAEDGLAAAGRPVDRVHYGGQSVVLTSDPHGTCLEVVEAHQPPTYRGVRINCTDLERSVEFYRAVLQLEADEPRTIVEDGERFRSRRLYLPRQRETFSLELTQWEQPAVTGTPYAAGNHAGIYRLAAAVDDMAASYADLKRAVPTAPPPVDVDLGDDLVVMPAVFFPDPDGTVVELLQRGLPR